MRVYLNRRDSLFVLRRITMNFLSPCSQQLARQGPAVMVTPVLPEIKPQRLRSLFVFYQISSFFPPSLVAHTLNSWVLVTFRKRGIFRHSFVSSARSQGVEVFLKLGRPWGLLKLEFFSQSSLAFLFICRMKASRCEISQEWGPRLPPQMAKVIAASFPLGSISPQSSSSTVKVSPATSSADVPVILDAVSQTVTLTSVKSRVC